MAEVSRPAVAFWGGLALLAALLFAERLAVSWPDVSTVGELNIDRVIFFYSTLPRAAVALLAGATLGLSGLLLQRILRNPLAEPSTLGISAGAQLAMAVATLHAPALMGYSPGLVAFLGGIAAVGLILALTWRRGLEPVAVVLAGMMVALTANALSGALILANGDYLFSLFIWGGGSLVQQSWGPTFTIGIRLLIGLFAALLLLRPLAILGLDDASARGLGVSLHTSRLLIVALAVWLATTVAAEVGVIGFIGLAAPALATLSGAQSLRQKLIAAPVIGAILLWLTDGLVQITATAGGERIPTGAATALLGGPLLLWLLPRLRLIEWPNLAAAVSSARRAMRPWTVIGILAACLAVSALVALLLGRDQEGLRWATGALADQLVALRAPRLLGAAAAGGLLAAAGVIVQRITANPLASPEVLGVGTGAGAGLAAVLILGGGQAFAWQLAGSAGGALAALVAILWFARSGGLGPERILLAGIAINALCSAVLTAVIALGNVQSYALLRWLTGSSNESGLGQAAIVLAALAAVAAVLLLTRRWLEVFQLGPPTAQALGVPVRLVRTMFVTLAAVATALAALFVGPLSFVGLIAPHIARLIGLTRISHSIVGAILIGALAMVLSEWLSRMVAFPYLLPLGLFASLLGGPYLIYLLGRGVERHG